MPARRQARRGGAGRAARAVGAVASQQCVIVGAASTQQCVGVGVGNDVLAASGCRGASGGGFSECGMELLGGAGRGQLVAGQEVQILSGRGDIERVGVGVSTHRVEFGAGVVDEFEGFGVGGFGLMPLVEHGFDAGQEGPVGVGRSTHAPQFVGGSQDVGPPPAVTWAAKGADLGVGGGVAGAQRVDVGAVGGQRGGGAGPNGAQAVEVDPRIGVEVVVGVLGWGSCSSGAVGSVRS